MVCRISAGSAAKCSALPGSPADGGDDLPKAWCCGDQVGQVNRTDRTIGDAGRQFLGTTGANAAGQMPGALRKSIFAVPFGCLVAVATHFVRFGDDHAFGGSANEAIASLAIGGSITIALVILHAFLTTGSTTVTGTIARTRVAALLPNGPTIFTLSAAVYYGIETLEGNGVELGFPTLVLALLAALVALTLRGLLSLIHI